MYDLNLFDISKFDLYLPYTEKDHLKITGLLN